MNRIPESQLVLAKDGSVYHLRLQPHQLADDIILVGDPSRVSLVSSFFDKIEHKISNRELVTHTGFYKGKRISAVSTGMGTDNIDIVVNELDALANIDLKTRTINKNLKSLNLIRLGTSGALQPDIPVGDSFVAGQFALGLDGLLHFYAGAASAIEQDYTKTFIAETSWPENFPTPYIVKASETLLKKLGVGYHHGTTATSPGFYAPQGRSLRLKLAMKDMNHQIENFSYKQYRITNFEMESSALYGLSKLLGHNALTICVIIANRVTEQFSDDYQPYIKKLIHQTLDRLVE